MFDLKDCISYRGKEPQNSPKKEPKKEKENSEFTQMSIFDFMNGMNNPNQDISKDAIDNMISMLQKKKQEIEDEEKRRREKAERQAREEKKRKDEEARLQAWLEKQKKEKERREREEQKALEAKRREEEHIKEVTSMELPMDWSNFFDTDDSTIGVKAETIPDGFVKCLNNRGCVDIEYIASITGEDYKTVIKALKGSIYQNPNTWGECFYKGWETAEEYLSGNIRQKLQDAMTADKVYHGYFKANVSALKKVLPPSVSAEDIYITLGSPWVPVEVIEDFICYLLKEPKIDNYFRKNINKRMGNTAPLNYADCRQYYNNGYRPYYVKHDEITGTWEFDWDYKWYQPYDFRQKYGTNKMGPFEILLKTLNQQSVAVTKTIRSQYTKSGKQSVIDKDETVLTMEKQKLFIKEFQRWVWEDEIRKECLEKLYEEQFASIRTRHYDGSFLELPGLDPAVSLYPYQKNAVARILFSPNTLLAHDVGSGKTFIMIAAGMELRRLGMSKKNMYVVPNNIIGQWRHIFYFMYPNADILCIEPKDFTPKKRQNVLEDIRDNDYDAVIIAYSGFSQIPISIEYQIDNLSEEREELVQRSDYRRNHTKKLEAKIDKLKEQEGELSLSRWEVSQEEGICFDQLGITRLFIDEAHNFKNVPIETKIDRVMGISKTGSVKCRDMMDKVHLVQHQNGGKGVILATGTPITNSITDAYIMQQYLQSGELAILELQSFDSWVGMFAEKTTNFEVDVDTSNYRMATRFAKFHNIPELTTMLASFADFHQMDETQGVPEHDGYQDVIVNKTADFQAYLEEISHRADDVRNGRVRRTDDNMLLITTDGRKAALELRLVYSQSAFSTNSKVFKCADTVSQIYQKTTQDRSTQLIFCDTSTPKEGFNMYDELKTLLTKMGVPAGEITYIHDATTESRREKIFADVRNGIIRVLIGSTFKLGLGVNVQNKLIALHHLDVPWRPADMVQREGRILRQGNENDKVEIYRYITEGSFDAYSWQLLETKQRFISDLLSGTAEDRSGADVDDTVLNYAEVKALAIGSPLIKQRVEVANELSKYLILQQKNVAQRQQYEKELSEMPEQIERIRKLIPLAEADAAYYEENKQKYDEDQRREIRHQIHAASHTEEVTTEERIVLEYQGFSVVVPDHVSKVHPLIYLRRAGQYMVELSDSDIGGLMRIDRCLDGLANRHKDLVKKLDDLETRSAFMQRELEKDQSYIDDIEACREKLAKLDEKLGVNKE